MALFGRHQGLARHLAQAQRIDQGAQLLAGGDVLQRDGDRSDGR